MQESKTLHEERGRPAPGRLLGFVVDNSTPIVARFVSSNPPPIGDYVLIEYPGGALLGLVEQVGTRSITLNALPGIYDPAIVEKLSGEMSEDDVFFECTARLLGDVDTLRMPRLPPLPGARVYQAPSELLQRVFGGKEPYRLRLGVLASRPDVPVYVDVNKLVTRHTAILAVTGAGKSNTVAVVVDRLVRIGGTVVIFDFHGEYLGSSLGGRVNIIEPVLNPRRLSTSELMVLLGVEQRYYKQERILRRALKQVQETGEEERGGFLETLARAVEHVSRRRNEDTSAAAAVVNKIESLQERYGDIIRDDAVDPVSRIRPGYANVIDLSRVDRDAADAVASHVLRILLAERKRHRLTGSSQVPYPVLVVVEEAHILAPRDEETLSKYWLTRIAREGRKFGLGLMLVSQRPKGLDPEILSQANNMIVLRIVEPSDQRYVQAASESLSDDLVAHLPSLNTGEAVVVGPFIRIPALVRIDKYPGKLGGSDIDVVAEWRSMSWLEAEAGGVDELTSDFMQ
ncbi:ATP synthase [Pyrodictium occultum]|uniref:ATP synthase n=1 Tax=Pyrodictium occultum TaxID=2309 RepID=A0A0V8RW37_PYROC|nr:ATP-binding protein [Pyrodictium occultum]KSW12253.1 ATP synthase [Pyrodictium occultum]